MGQAQINVRTRACSGTFIARTKQAALTHNVRGERLTRDLIISQTLILVHRVKYRTSAITLFTQSVINNTT